MTIQAKFLGTVAVLAFGVFAATSPAQALTSQECSAKYQAAKTAGTLAGKTWNDFRKAECGSDAVVATATAPAAAKDADAKPKKEAAPASATSAAPAGPVTFPSAIDPKYSKEKASQARMHTCADQWKANKAANTTGGMRWIEKGGGFWSECNKKLKV
jgi:hypothetical protein